MNGLWRDESLFLWYTQDWNESQGKRIQPLKKLSLSGGDIEPDRVSENWKPYTKVENNKIQTNSLPVNYFFFLVSLYNNVLVENMDSFPCSCLICQHNVLKNKGGSPPKGELSR